MPSPSAPAGKSQASGLPVIDLGRLLGPGFRRPMVRDRDCLESNGIDRMDHQSWQGPSDVAAAAPKRAERDTRPTGDNQSLTSMKASASNDRPNGNASTNVMGVSTGKPLSEMKSFKNGNKSLLHASNVKAKGHDHSTRDETLMGDENAILRHENAQASTIAGEVQVLSRKRYAVRPHDRSNEASLKRGKLVKTTGTEGIAKHPALSFDSFPRAGDQYSSFAFASDKKLSNESKFDDTKEQDDLPGEAKSVGDIQVVLSANRCVPIQAPNPSMRTGTFEDADAISLPEHRELVNFPDYIRPSTNESKRNCVMCGQLCVYALSRKAKSEGAGVIIPNNKNVCTLCQAVVWRVTESMLLLKWCQCCNYFRPWLAFGEKAMVTCCTRCRARKSAYNKRRQIFTSGVATISTEIVTNSLRCVPLQQPIPSGPSSTLEEAERVPLPEHALLVNYPNFIGKKATKEGTKMCVMCGQSRPYFLSGKQESGTAPIMTPNYRNVCTSCITIVWVKVDGMLQIKWCNACKKFCPWAAFRANEGTAKTCTQCRQRMRDYKAKQK